jgi:EAL domain-containing protein (putative c-di-GMP-specific phosphodiesterase class I)/ActR/RegA family two-component response regulator
MTELAETPAGTPAPRLLIVEDDEQFARFVARAARQAGFDVRVAATAIEAWSEAEKGPALVFLDLNLPGSDGLAILRGLAERACRAPIHIFSGADRRVLRSVSRLAEELGLRVGEPLAKPIDLDDLRRVLAAARAPAKKAGRASSGATPLPELSAADLGAGIERGELFVVFQPIVDLATLELRGAEALVRWRHPRHGVVSPLAFVPLAERSGLVLPMTEEVLRQALRFAAGRFAAATDGAPSISVNLAPAALADPGLSDRLGSLLAASGVAPRQLVIEVTESAALADRLSVLEVLNRLRLRGLELSIDDFGTGTSSLERVDQLPCSELKIERAFVSQIGRRGEAEAIVHSTIDLARRLGLRTVGEGIETAEVLAWLRRAGCDSGQGFLFARGLEPADFDAWLAAWPARRREIDAATPRA